MTYVCSRVIVRCRVCFELGARARARDMALLMLLLGMLKGMYALEGVLADDDGVLSLEGARCRC